MIRILCIDDSKAIHAYLRDCFTDLPVELMSKYDGQQGIDFIKENKIPFDVILLDWEMPIKTGPEVLAEVVKQKLPCPVIMMTSKNQLSDIQEMLASGAKEYVMKPFTKDIILDKIAAVSGKPIVG